MNSLLNICRRHRFLSVVAGFILVAAIFFSIVSRPSVFMPIRSYAQCLEAGYPMLDTDPPICREGSHSFTGTPAPKPALVPAKTSVAFEVLVDGDTHGAVPAHDQQLINSTAGWDAYWRQVHSELPTLPPIFPVDFTTSSVLGVSLGRQGTGGYGLKITSVLTSDAGTEVSVTETTPTVTCAVTQQLSNRYVIVRTVKLREPVSFRIFSEKRHCQ